MAGKWLSIAMGRLNMQIDPASVQWDAPRGPSIDPSAVKWDSEDAGFFTKPAPPLLGGVPRAPSVAKMLYNTPASAAKFAGGVVELVTAPIETAKGLGRLVSGAGLNAAEAALPASTFGALKEFIGNPEYVAQAIQTADAAGGALKARYGSLEALKNTIETDPVGFAGDFSLLTKGLSMATKSVAPGTSNALAQMSNRTDPLMLAIQGGVGGVNALRVAAGNIPNLRDAGVNMLTPYVDPGAAAANKFVQSIEDPGAAAAGLRATQNAFVTPGAPALSAAERMVEAGVPSVGAASLERGFVGEPGKIGQQMLTREIEQRSAIQQHLARVEQQIQTQAASMAPADPSQLRQVRNDLLRGLADEQTALANTAQGVAQPLPTVRQAEVGGAIQMRGAERSEQLKKEYIRPGFREAFSLDAPTPSINLARSMATAERLVGDMGAFVDPTKVSPSVRNLLRLDTDAVSGPPVVSLEDFQSVRAALRKQETAAARTDPTRAGALEAVIRQMDADLAGAPIPQGAKDALAEARRRVSEVQVPMFRTGETSKMLSRTTRNMPGTLPSQQVQAFLETPESAAQFVRTFESDPRALQSMQQGILDLYRRDIVDPTTKVVDAKKAAAFEADYTPQLDTLEAAGLNVRETMAMVRQDAMKVQRATAALASEAKKFGEAKSAKDVVDLALKSPMDMRFVRERLTPQARTALTDELTNRATTFIQNGDAAGALKYLTNNKRALTVGFGKAGAKTYADLVDLAEMQKKFLSVAALAPKTNLVTPVTLAKELTPAQLTNLQVVIKDLDRSGAVAELGVAKDRAVGKIASEGALEAGVAPSRIPGFFNQIVTASKSALKNILDFQDRRVSAALFDMMINRPDDLIPILEKAARAKTAAPTTLSAPRPLTIPVSVNRLTGAAPAAAAAGREDNQNAMAR
jgi:hypothetical protein